MNYVEFDRSEYGEKLYVTLVNSDLNEGRGFTVVHSVHSSLNAAEAAAYGADVMGTEGTVRSVPFGVGCPGQAIWGWNNVSPVLFGRVHQDGYVGPAYMRLADVPNLTKNEWAEYGRLAKTAGRNPLVERAQARRTELLERKGFLIGGESNYTKPLFAIVTDDTRGRGTDFGSFGSKTRSPERLIVAVLDTDGNEERAADLFVAASNSHSLLSTHHVVELFLGKTRDEMFGRTIELPKSDELTARLLGEHADGTVFFIPGTVDEYVLRNGVLYTEDGYEADIVGLSAQGIRVRTDSDMADIAYTRMQGILSKASSAL
jgi:hypothetical protein